MAVVLIRRSVFLYLCSDSMYYKNPDILNFIEALCTRAEEDTHEDGTNDLVISNYRQPEFFHAPGLCHAYRAINALPNKTERETEISEKLYHSRCV